jgi:hypothetical protein
MIGSMLKEDHRRVTTLWRVTVEAWLRRQGLISVRHNQKVSPIISKIGLIIEFAAQWTLTAKWNNAKSLWTGPSAINGSCPQV